MTFNLGFCRSLFLVLAMAGCTLTHWHKVCPDGTEESFTQLKADGEVIGKIVDAVDLLNGLVRVTVEKEDGSTITQDVDKRKFDKAQAELDKCIEDKLKECEDNNPSFSEGSLVSAYELDEYTEGDSLTELEPTDDGRCCEFTCEVSIDDDANVKTRSQGSLVAPSP